MNPLAIPILSQRKLNTYGVESPCNHLPGVGSFLANPGLSKEQLVPSCVVRAFMLTDVFIGILAYHLRRCIVLTCTMIDISIEILARHLRRCVMRTFVKWGDYYFLYSLGLTPDFILKKFVKADWSLNPKSNASSPIGLSVIRSCLQASP